MDIDNAELNSSTATTQSPGDNSTKVATTAYADAAAAATVTSITGTANQISASASTGDVTLSLPSSISTPGSLTVTGDLTVNGTTTTVNSTTVTTADNLILINDGEAGAGVTAGTAGIEVDRGSLTNYQFVFRESDDVFAVGEVGSLQSVATREDAPTSTGLAFWNNTSSRFDTASGLTWNGTQLSASSITTGAFTASGAASFSGSVSIYKDFAVLFGFSASFSGSVSCAEDVTITAGSDSTPALNIKRFSSSGTAQIDFQNESGTVYWETGMIGPGALSYYFYDGVGTPIQMVYGGNIIFNPAGSIVCSKAVSMSSTLGVTGATTLSSTLTAKTTLIKAVNDSDVAIQTRRATATGKAQHSFESENGSIYWRHGLTNAGSTDYIIYDGTQNVVTMERNSDMTLAPGGNLIFDGTRGSDTRYIQSYFSSAAVYNAAPNGTEERVVSGFRYYWYTNYWQLGATRGGSTDINDFVISKNGTEVLVMDTDASAMTTTDLTLNGELTIYAADSVTNFWANSSVAEGVSIQTDYISANTSGRIFYVENSNKLYGFSLIYNGGASVFNGDTITTAGGNTFSIVRHDNSVAGAVVMSIARSSGDITFNGSCIFDLPSNTLEIVDVDTNNITVLVGGSTTRYVPLNSTP